MLFVVILRVPAQRRVGRNNHIAVTELFGIERLDGRRFSAVVAGLRPHTLRSGNNLDIRIVDVDRSSVYDLSAGTRTVVEHHFGFNDAWSNVPFSLRNQLVIGTAHVGVIADGPGKCCAW